MTKEIQGVLNIKCRYTFWLWDSRKQYNYRADGWRHNSPWTRSSASDSSPSASAVTLPLSETMQLWMQSMWHNPLLEMTARSFRATCLPFKRHAKCVSSGETTHLKTASSPSQTVILRSSAMNSTTRGAVGKAFSSLDPSSSKDMQSLSELLFFFADLPLNGLTFHSDSSWCPVRSGFASVLARILFH